MSCAPRASRPRCRHCCGIVAASRRCSAAAATPRAPRRRAPRPCAPATRPPRRATAHPDARPGPQSRRPAGPAARRPHRGAGDRQPFHRARMRTTTGAARHRSPPPAAPGTLARGASPKIEDQPHRAVGQHAFAHLVARREVSRYSRMWATCATQCGAHRKGAQRAGGHARFGPVQRVVVEPQEEAFGHDSLCSKTRRPASVARSLKIGRTAQTGVRRPSSLPTALPVLYSFRRCPYAMRARLRIDRERHSPANCARSCCATSPPRCSPPRPRARCPCWCWPKTAR
jgi:hypothetical protein